MNQVFLALAKKKWFVPLTVFLMLIIVTSSLSDLSSDSDTTALTVEEQLEALCNSISGVKNAKVMITYEAVAVSGWGSSQSKDEKILGIAIVCDGGGDPGVQLTLHRMIEALFDLPSTRITVSERNQV